MSCTSTNFCVEALRALGSVLQYPGEDFEKRLTDARYCLRSCPAAQTALNSFANAISTLRLDARQELSTATFDVTPACIPYISIYLFGEENYKRGEFMAALEARYRQTGFERRQELPDHLANLLGFAARVDDAEREELVTFCLLGPLAQMIPALNHTNPYRSLLESIQHVLRACYPHATAPLSPVEQMRRHGNGCVTATASCGCSMVEPGPADDAAAITAAQHPSLNR